MVCHMSSSEPSLPVWGGGGTSSDLTARARIGNAALVRFAEHGFTGTSLRAVAESAGVSVGLVQHHFGTKAALRAACDAYVAAYVETQVARAVDGREMADGDFLAESYRSGPPVMDYLARALVDDSPGAAALFDDLVATAERHVRLPEGEDGPPPASARSVAAVLTAMKLGVSLLRPHVTRLLDPDGTRDVWPEISRAVLAVVSPAVTGGEITELATKGLADYASRKEER
jgi:AcrR family transcriptional regulator